MERYSEADLDELQRKVEDLQRQNQILRLICYGKQILNKSLTYFCIPFKGIDTIYTCFLVCNVCTLYLNKILFKLNLETRKRA